MMALPKPLNDLFRPPPTPGVLAVFPHLDTTLAAIKQLRGAGHTDFTVYSPIPRHEIEDALGQAVSPVRMFTLVGGIAGCSIGAWITLWMSADSPRSSASSSTPCLRHGARARSSTTRASRTIALAFSSRRDQTRPRRSS